MTLGRICAIRGLVFSPPCPRGRRCACRSSLAGAAPQTCPNKQVSIGQFVLSRIHIRRCRSGVRHLAFGGCGLNPICAAQCLPRFWLIGHWLECCGGPLGFRAHALFQARGCRPIQSLARTEWLGASPKSALSSPIRGERFRCLAGRFAWHMQRCDVLDFAFVADSAIQAAGPH